MKRRTTCRLLAAGFALALIQAVSANDGFGGLTATGLQFDRTASVQMLKEDLYVSLRKIKVAYVFRNTGASDVTGEVIFPLPPIALMGLDESDFAIDREKLDGPNFVNFTVSVDGKPVQAKADRIAVIQPPYDENRPIADVYTAPGRDVTAALQKYRVPLSLNTGTVMDALSALPEAAKTDLASQEIIFLDGTTAMPAWSVIERFHWTQNFPAGTDVKISHSYDGAFPGSIFGWSQTSEPDSYQEQVKARYCIDPGTQKAIKNAMTRSEDGAYWTGIAHYVDYVLTTANTWAGPIGDFKLTIDKGHPKNVISLCIDGIKKTGPTTFVVEKTNFTPKDDLSILLIQSVDAPAP